MNAQLLTAIISGAISVFGVVIAAVISGRHDERESEISAAPDLADKLREAYSSNRDLSLQYIEVHKLNVELRTRLEESNKKIEQLISENNRLKKEIRQLGNQEFGKK